LVILLVDKDLGSLGRKGKGTVSLFFGVGRVKQTQKNNKSVRPSGCGSEILTMT